MLKTVSPIYDHAYVGKWIYQVMGLEIDEAWDFFKELRLQAFPETATWGIAYWEQQYHLPSDKTLTIEERRRRVISRRGKRSPMNPARIELIIGNMTGAGVETIENVAPYTFRVMVKDEGTGIDTSIIFDTLVQIKPSHQSFEVEVNTKTHRRKVFVQGGVLNVTNTELPEWEMHYNFNAVVNPAGIVTGIHQTILPSIEQ